MSNRLKATVYGCVAGGFVGLALLVYWTGRTALGSIDGVTLTGAARGRSDFVVSSGGMYFRVLVSAVLGGLAIGGIFIRSRPGVRAGEPEVPTEVLAPDGRGNRRDHGLRRCPLRARGVGGRSKGAW